MTEHHSEAWWAERDAGIGSSEIAGLLHLSNHCAPWSIWAEKVGLIPRDGDNDTDRLWFGRAMEPVLAEAFTRRTGLEVAGEQTFVRHPEWPFMRGTLDGFAMPPGADSIDDALGVVEFKTDARGGWRDGVPPIYRAQALWLAGITGLHRAWIGVLHSRFEFEVHELTWDQAAEDDWQLMVATATRFWEDHVLTGIPPAVDGSDATADAIAAVWPNHVPDTVHEADGELAELLRSRAEIKARMAADKKVVDHFDNELAALVRDCELIAVDGRPAWSYKAQQRSTVDAKALRSAHPEIDLEPYTNVSTYRVLRPIKESK
jgi:putative phage-type endonuclease